MVDWPHKAESKSYFPPKGEWHTYTISISIHHTTISYTISLYSPAERVCSSSQNPMLSLVQLLVIRCHRQPLNVWFQWSIDTLFLAQGVALRYSLWLLFCFFPSTSQSFLKRSHYQQFIPHAVVRTRCLVGPRNPVSTSLIHLHMHLHMWNNTLARTRTRTHTPVYVTEDPWVRCVSVEMSSRGQCVWGLRLPSQVVKGLPVAPLVSTASHAGNQKKGAILLRRLRESMGGGTTMLSVRSHCDWLVSCVESIYFHSHLPWTPVSYRLFLHPS